MRFFGRDAITSLSKNDMQWDVHMQTLSQNRNGNRVFLFVLISVLIIISSWKITSSFNTNTSLPNLDVFASDASRSGASTTAQIESLQTHLRASPEDWQSYSQLGVAYLQRARETGDPTYYQKAEESLNKALASQPDDYVSISAMGALALARHDFHSALEWGERAIQINPDRPYAYGVIADAQIELGSYDDAVVTLQTMVDLRPDMNSYARISYIRELYGDTSGALEMMQQAVDSGVPNSESTAWLRTQLGNLYFNTGDQAKAELEYQRTLQNYPDYVYALAGLGRVHAARGEMVEAIELLNQAVALMPMPEFVITLGDLYHAAGDEDAARQQYELVAAIQQIYRANGVDMDMEIALFNADHNQRIEETLALAQQAYANRPSIHAADALGWALYKSEDYTAAQKYSDQALQLGTNDSLKLFHAGMIALQLGDENRARQYLERALEINPHFSILYAGEAKEILQSLDE